ncbi:MAG: hypothetical protein JJU27_07240 [Gammaproteobacteria bacterium]|nr:hypothetical protein [Gammaproteobacteria bacterium]
MHHEIYPHERTAQQAAAYLLMNSEGRMPIADAALQRRVLEQTRVALTPVEWHHLRERLQEDLPWRRNGQTWVPR